VSLLTPVPTASVCVALQVSFSEAGVTSKRRRQGQLTGTLQNVCARSSCQREKVTRRTSYGGTGAAGSPREDLLTLGQKLLEVDRPLLEEALALKT
jgi:hypothetical protein